MKRFLSQLLLFTIPILLYFLANTAINYFIIENQRISIGKHQVLVVGDSHPQRSINPKFWDRALNISQSAEPYVLTYWKLKKVLANNSPDTVIVGFAPHNISTLNDFKFSKDEWAGEMFRRSYSIADLEGINNSIPLDLDTYYKTLWKEMALYPKVSHTSFMGAYSNNNANNVSDWEFVIGRHYYSCKEECGVSTTAVNYLDSIVHICQQREIPLLLLNTPVHQKYADNVPATIKSEYENLKALYQNQGVLIYDRATDLNYPDSLFLNADHLNHSGARRFTIDLVKELSQRSIPPQGR